MKVNAVGPKKRRALRETINLLYLAQKRAAHRITTFDLTCMYQPLRENRGAFSSLLVHTMPRTQYSPVLLGHESRRVVLQELRLSDQLLQQGQVAVLVQLHLQRHLSLASYSKRIIYLTETRIWLIPVCDFGTEMLLKALTLPFLR